MAEDNPIEMVKYVNKNENESKKISIWKCSLDWHQLTLFLRLHQNMHDFAWKASRKTVRLVCRQGKVKVRISEGTIWYFNYDCVRLVSK